MFMYKLFIGSLVTAALLSGCNSKDQDSLVSEADRRKLARAKAAGETQVRRSVPLKSSSKAANGRNPPQDEDYEDFADQENLVDSPENSVSKHVIHERIDMEEFPKQGKCRGKKYGVYSWKQQSWRSASPPLIEHFTKKNARQYTCGDVHINVADYSNPTYIKNVELLVPFIMNVRNTGNDATVYVTYGDVETKNATACKFFIDTFFDFVGTLTSDEIVAIQPIGVSFDIEHFPKGETEKLLKYAQTKKAVHVSKFKTDGLKIQWTIEGRPNPIDTDAVMRYADSALAMIYRSYLYKPEDPEGKGGLLARARFFLKEVQCPKCLDDSYAKANYKAKITIMVEANCAVEEYCARVSMCAFAESNGHRHVIETLDQFEQALTSSGLMTEEQKRRLLNQDTMFSIHDWEHWQCYYNDPNDTNDFCPQQPMLAAVCKENGK